MAFQPALLPRCSCEFFEDHLLPCAHVVKVCQSLKEEGLIFDLTETLTAAVCKSGFEATYAKPMALHLMDEELLQPVELGGLKRKRLFTGVVGDADEDRPPPSSSQDSSNFEGIQTMALRGRNRCGHCRQVGHIKRKCPELQTTSTASLGT